MRNVVIRAGNEVVVFDDDHLIVTVTRYPEGDWDVMYEDLDRENSTTLAFNRKEHLIRSDDLFDIPEVRDKLNQLAKKPFGRV